MTETTDFNDAFIDSSKLIQELIHSDDKVMLFPRASRLTRTLDLEIIQQFFDITQNSRSVFAKESILEQTSLVEKYMNKYPVIQFSFNSLKGISYDAFVIKVSKLMAKVYEVHQHVSEDFKLGKPYIEMFRLFRNGKASYEVLGLSIDFLARCLMRYYEKRVIILIDDFDVPFEHAKRLGFSENVTMFMREYLCSVFNDNENLEFGVLTGVDCSYYKEIDLKCSERSL